MARKMQKKMPRDQFALLAAQVNIRFKGAYARRPTYRKVAQAINRSHMMAWSVPECQAVAAAFGLRLPSSSTKQDYINQIYEWLLEPEKERKRHEQG